MSSLCVLARFTMCAQYMSVILSLQDCDWFLFDDLFALASFRGKKDKRRERSRDRKDRSTSRKRSRKDEDRIKGKAKPMKVTKLKLKLEHH